MSDFTSWLFDVRGAPTTAAATISILRVATGLAIVRYHGWHKIVAGVQWRLGRVSAWPFAEEVREAGFPYPIFNAWLAAALQLGGGLCLVAGLLTRPGALVIVGTLLGAVYTNIRLHKDSKDSQLASLYLLLNAAVCGLGPGPWSLDSILFR